MSLHEFQTIMNSLPEKTLEAFIQHLEEIKKGKREWASAD